MIYLFVIITETVEVFECRIESIILTNVFYKYQMNLRRLVVSRV